jgi:isopenicillin N synthase-like dioxygenase
VVNPPGEAARQPRYSTPYFLHANPDYLIKTLPVCISAGQSRSLSEPITANDYLMQRLREIKLA